MPAGCSEILRDSDTKELECLNKKIRENKLTVFREAERQMKLICLSGAEPLPSFLHTCCSLITSVLGHQILGLEEGGERSPKLWLGSGTLFLASAGPA